MNFMILFEDFVQLLAVLPQTLLLAVTIFILSILIGTVMALIQEYNVPVLKQIVVVFKLLLRGTSLIVFIFFMYCFFRELVCFFTLFLNFGYNYYDMSN